jgi:hypothetical protein
MLLTDEEWEDVASMLTDFRKDTRWVTDCPPGETNSETDQYLAILRRQRALASRIIDAAEA